MQRQTKEAKKSDWEMIVTDYLIVVVLQIFCLLVCLFGRCGLVHCCSWWWGDDENPPSHEQHRVFAAAGDDNNDDDDDWSNIGRFNFSKLSIKKEWLSSSCSVWNHVCRFHHTLVNAKCCVASLCSIEYLLESFQIKESTPTDTIIAEWPVIVQLFSSP